MYKQSFVRLTGSMRDFCVEPNKLKYLQTDGMISTTNICSIMSAEQLSSKRGARIMWIFTKYGFYSAVCARQGDGKKHQPVDPDRIMVRARARQHLDNLVARFPDEFQATAKS